MYKYEPHVSYGPFYFGMPTEEAIAILGQPLAQTTMQHHLEFAQQFPADINEPLSDEQRQYFSGWLGYDFLNSEQDNAIPSLLFQDKKLVEIRLRNIKDEIDIFGINVFDKNRQKIIWHLFDKDGEVYVNREHYYFPNLGIATSDPSDWRHQGMVSFVDKAYVTAFINALEFEKLQEPNFKRIT